ncbi:hypothetical protein [Actibacterium sp. 188UL27-1]|uniref:hypothetical protein n=1 Tax=Actibacterium sp. 188UL27-1 TaxID=2786961 RepID=UPI00195B55A9|nr:hypothetical protein [Actibacterium sp. 188UL27-1]MBM7070265.1 hypothetical protein [Actibacterium sp. 188UL27-1]
MPLILFSHVVNIAVAGLLAVLIMRGAPSMDPVYGADSPARRILGCVYGAIALASVLALGIYAVYGRDSHFVWLTTVLFSLQIVYKLLTVPVVGLSHPVPRANLAISVLHVVSLMVLLR